jgi:hypothetical protein
MLKLPLLFLLPASLMACKCAISFGVCNSVASSDLVFIGTVEKIEPGFLDPWNPKRLSQLPTEEILRLTQDESSGSLARLKQIYTRIYPNMPEYFKRQFADAKSVHELGSAIDAIGAEGLQVRIRVKKYFKRPLPDDDDADDEDDEVVTVWTPSNDCGFPFQTGETYLVYTDQDDETNRIETSICTRTKRLTDGGADLAYLYFRQTSEDQATRLEGFASHSLYQDTSHTADSVEAPAADVVVELKGAEGTRYATTGADGRYIFDGLAAGKYTLTPFSAGFPAQVHALAASTQFLASRNSCAREVLIIPK